MRGFAARLQAQDWVAITIELTIVVVGVFIGTQVSNWGTGRIERAETERMLCQLHPQLAGNCGLQYPYGAAANVNSAANANGRFIEKAARSPSRLSLLRKAPF